VAVKNTSSSWRPFAGRSARDLGQRAVGDLFALLRIRTWEHTSSRRLNRCELRMRAELRARGAASYPSCGGCRRVEAGERFVEKNDPRAWSRPQAMASFCFMRATAPGQQIPLIEISSSARSVWARAGNPSLGRDGHEYEVLQT